MCAIPEASHRPSRGSGETGRDAATAALWKKHAHDQVRDSAYKPSVFSICFMRSRRSTNGSLRQHTISLPKKPQDSRNRAAFIGDIPDRADSLYNHVINHARIACVYVINTHATAGSDRGLDDFALLVHNAPAPFENITARIIRAILANNEGFGRLLTGSSAFLRRHFDERSRYRYWFCGSTPMPFVPFTRRTRLRECQRHNQRAGEGDNCFFHYNASLLMLMVMPLRQVS